MSQGAVVVVAGAGALGLSCALALADAGCRVTVCDAAPAGSNASGVAAGMLAPVFETVLDGRAEDFDLLMAARDLWPAFAARAGIALDRSGALAVGSPDWLARIASAVEGLGTPVQTVEAGALAAMAPGLAPGFSQGLATTDDWRIEAAAALGALRAAASAAGVVFRDQAVTGRGAADWLVAATGAAQGLAPELHQLAPIKGQIARFAGSARGGPVLRGEGAYAAPTAQGLLVGATMERGLSDTRPDLAALAPVIAAATRLLPALAAADFSLSAGVRAATPDGLPMAGPSRGDPRVLLAAGARRNGWLLAPMVAELVAAQITGRAAGPYAARMDPARFSPG